MVLLHYQPPLAPYLNIVFQDEHIIVLDKPSGLLSVPGKAPQHQDSLQTRVQRVFPNATVVHRLDMATSGLMVMAMHKAAHRHLSKQFETRLTHKIYEAEVFGHPLHDEGEINLPLICDWPNRPKQMVDKIRGKHALTRWKILARYTRSSRVALYPVTGRSHQLRVHMLSIGHPIVGDRLYAHPEALDLSERLRLHARTLAFQHPQHEQVQTFTSAVPF
jgi:tRNA pseudouridine32 synthase / 23S rRNA pseudouridine746 synthase